MSDGMKGAMLRHGYGWQPDSLIQVPPLFTWPVRPLGLLRAVFGIPGYLWPWNTVYAAIAFATWLFATPDLTTTSSLTAGWIMRVFLRNLALILLVAGAWHWRLYILRAQGTRYKYDGRWPAANSPKFLFHNQVADNILWTFVSAVPIWTAYELLTLWAQANHFVPVVTWTAHPLYCLLLMVCIPLLNEIHFYLVHRLLHWPPLYRLAHSLHHRNVNPGPWSGLAMHPLEHLLYFSAVLLHWIIPSHPFHVLYHLQHLALSPAQGHSGFGRVLVTGHEGFSNDHYVHYLHHRYFEVNYGADQFVPMDVWFGTFHDGSEKAHAAMNQRVRERRATRRT